MKISKQKDYWQCEFKTHTLLAFTFKDLMRDLLNVYSVKLPLFNFELN